MKDMPWDHALAVTADGDGLAGHAGGVILREMSDRSGLTSALKDALAREDRFPEIDRGVAMVSAAVMIALGGESMSGIAVLEHLSAVLGEPVTWQTLRRTLDLAGPVTLGKIAQARARIRAHVWELIAARAGGFPWLEIAGRILEGWTVIDMDATLITAYSRKENAAGTYKSGFGFHPLGSWCANTQESLHMELRPGNAGSNTASDHISGLSASLFQVPACYRRKILVRLDGAGTSHDFITHMMSLEIPGGKLLFTSGWTITGTDENDIRQIPPGAWKPGVTQDGHAEDDSDVAEITGLMSRAGNWPPGLRWIIRRVRPSRRHLKNLTAYERETGWKYSIICTNIPEEGLEGVPGSLARPVHRRAASPARRRRGRRTDREGRRTAQPSVEVVAGQLRLDRRREHRRRSAGMVPPPRALRHRGPERRRTRYPASPPVARAGQARPPRPPPDPENQPRLAVE